MTRLLLFILLSVTFKTYAISLKSAVIIRSLKYESIPIKRQKIRNQMDISRFQNNSLSVMRYRLNPRLNLLNKAKVDFKKVKTADYNDFNQVFFLEDLSQDKFSTLKFPLNIKFLINRDKTRIEMGYISIERKSSFIELVQYINKLRSIFAKKLTYKTPERKGRLLSKNEKEMLELIRKKSVRFSYIDDYFGFYLGRDLFIESDYYKDFKASIGSQFAKSLSKVKDQVYSDSKITSLVDLKQLNNIANIVQSLNLKNDYEPFVLPSYKLSKKIIRVDKDFNGYYCSLIHSSSEVNSSKKIFQNILNKLN